MNESASEKADGAATLWALKPWWCQPWTIISTGVVLTAASWVLSHRWWISAPIAAVVVVWWWLFLVAVPLAYREQIKQPRQGN